MAGISLGIAPDLFSFGLFHLSHPYWMVSRLAGEISGPPALSILPAYVFYAYNLTHSLVVWSIVFLALSFVKRTLPWLWAAWGLHIICDIPSHATDYFPTPFMWPFSPPFVDGISWATAGFLVANYAALVTAYAVMVIYLRKRRRVMSS